MTDYFAKTIQNVKSSIEDFTISATDTVTNEAKNTLDRLGDVAGDPEQIFNNLTTNFTKTAGGLSGATAKAKASILEATDTMTTGAKNTLDRLGVVAGDPEQTFNNLTANFTKTVGGLNEATAKAKASVLEATNSAVKTLTEASDSAANTVKETTVRATGALNDATNVSVHKINDATTSISEAADKTKISLDAALHKAEQLSNAISNSIQEVVSSSIQTWMAEHPSLVWVVTHPLLAIVSVILLLSLLNTSIKFVPQLFLFVLKSLSIGAFNTFQSVKPKDLNTQDQLTNILIRLEELRQEQDALMKEVKEVLISKKQLN